MKHHEWLEYSLLPPKSLQSTSSKHSWHSMDTLTAAAFVRIKAANLHKALPSKIFSSANSITPSNPPVLIVPPRMVLQKFTMTSLLFGPGLYSMAWATPQSSGWQPYSIQSTCTTNLPTMIGAASYSSKDLKCVVCHPLSSSSVPIEFPGK